MLKTKVIKILPYWLIILGIICCVFIISALSRAGQGTAPIEIAQAQTVPQVLGAQTVVRGEQTDPTSVVSQTVTPDLSGVKAKSFLIFDLATGQEFFGKSTSTKFSIASLTKLLTALVTYQNLDLNQSMDIQSSDVLKVRPDLDLVIGDRIKIADVFNAMLIGSCNDAALALAEYVQRVTGQNFPDLMNRQAQSLGMADSHFANPMGFDSAGNYSTTEDIKKLIIATQNLSVFKDLGRRTSYRFTSDLGNTYSTLATNTLIKNYSDLQAIKTGYTTEAGGAMATKLEISGREIVILVLDSPNREADTLYLRKIILNDYSWN